MPRCFMAKKLKYPYEAWRAARPLPESGQRPSPESGQRPSSESGQGPSQEVGPGPSSEDGQGPSSEDGQGPFAETVDRSRPLADLTPGPGGPGAPQWPEGPEARLAPGGSDDDEEEEEESDDGEPEDLSCPRGLFRPYCLKDPTEYKYDRPGLQDPYPYSSSYLACRNLEDLSTAQAILDLSAPHRTDLPPAPALHIKTEHYHDNGPIYRLNSGKTTAYTYEAFFASDGRSKKVPVLPEEPKPKYTCSECGKHYATSSNLSRHRQTHRTLDSGSAKKCHICNKMYVSMPALSMHVLTHNLNHKCDVCGKAFSRPWLLQGHMRSHTGDKPYGCAHCGKSFADRSNLRAHMQTHSAFKNFNCKRCNKSFALKSYLNKHYESACFKDQPIPSIDTPPSTPTPCDLSEEPDPDLAPLGFPATPHDCLPSNPTPPASSPPPLRPAPRHIIHIPTPIFPCSATQLIKV